MHLPINVKSPNNISKWQVGFNSSFKGLMIIIGSEFVSLNDVLLSEYLIGLCAKGTLPTVNQLLCIALQHLRTPNEGKGKGKAILLQAWTGLKDSRRLMLADFKTIST
jgi:hypothetical protein